ncbi:cobyric acid synthase [Halorubrum vacuolatum]|uniref:cobyric acid synthase n=1 Tax=Halorubrum vacuolatum TaxID=63740 RepID=UPI000B78ADE3|nr:cobyric acid synthase [Halorubrum vacuolatum]
MLVAGTASHVGKSTVAAGLCRLLADAGVEVAPYKAQNMSNNARAVSKSAGSMSREERPPTGTEPGFGEIGVSQYVQARAARVPAETDHNPVLLKPRGEGESQLVVNGEAVAHYAAGEYYEDHWHAAREAAVAAHRRLAGSVDVVVAEGAGSIAEINLHDRDLANVETARFADAEILLVADIERGGVFASLVGTLELLPADLRDRVVGAVITKFRGDVSLLDPGIDAFEERTGVPILGVVPYEDPGLPEEDSVALPAVEERAVHGADDGVPESLSVTVAVPRLPRISNATDLEPLAAEPGVRVAYVPLDDPLGTADAVVLPGTKNTVDDLLACREAGFDEALRRFSGPIVGLCGGYQLLGERIRNADIESARLDESEAGSDGAIVDAVGLLPVETTFDADKRVVATELRFDAALGGPLSDAEASDTDDDSLSLAGYEIHMGATRGLVDGLSTPFRDPQDGRSGAALGAARGDVLGTYLHGLFENGTARTRFIAAVRDHAGIDPTDLAMELNGTDRTSPYDRAADLLSAHVDLAPLGLPRSGISTGGRSGRR